MGTIALTGAGLSAGCTGILDGTEELEEEIDSLENQLDERNSTIDGLEADIAERDAEISDLQEELTAEQDALDSLEEASQDELREQLTKRYELAEDGFWWGYEEFNAALTYDEIEEYEAAAIYFRGASRLAMIAGASWDELVEFLEDHGDHEEAIEIVEGAADVGFTLGAAGEEYAAGFQFLFDDQYEESQVRFDEGRNFQEYAFEHLEDVYEATEFEAALSF